MIQVPVFHVNGDDPEAVLHCVRPRHGLPPALRRRRGDRHGLLPTPRSQRGRRAELSRSRSSTSKHPQARVGTQAVYADQPRGRGRSAPAGGGASASSSEQGESARSSALAGPSRARPPGPGRALRAARPRGRGYHRTRLVRTQGLDTSVQRRGALTASPSGIGSGTAAASTVHPQARGHCSRSAARSIADDAPHRLGEPARRWRSAALALEQGFARAALGSGQQSRGTFSQRHAVFVRPGDGRGVHCPSTICPSSRPASRSTTATALGGGACSASSTATSRGRSYDAHAVGGAVR